MVAAPDPFSVFSLLVSPWANVVAERYLLHTRKQDDFASKQVIRKELGASDQMAAKRMFEIIAQETMKYVCDCLVKQTEAENVRYGSVNLDKAYTNVSALMRYLIEHGFISANIFLENTFRPIDIDAAVRSHKSQGGSLLESLTDGLSDVEMELFNFTLDRFIHATCNLFSAVQPLRQADHTWTVGRLNHIAEQIDNVMSTLVRIEAAVRKQAPGTDQHAELVYRNELWNAANELQIMGIDVDPRAKSIPLDSGYVRLTLERTSTGGEGISIESAIMRCRQSRSNLLIRGPAGSGKTTLSRWLALRYSGYVQAEDDPGSAALTPFVIVLRDAPNSDLNFVDFLRFPNLTGYLDGSWVRSKIESGNCMLVFDGLDEVPRPRREAALSFARLASTLNQSNTAVFTSRPTLEPIRPVSLESYLIATINPLSPSEQGRLVDLWFSSLIHTFELDQSGIGTTAYLSDLRNSLKVRISEDRRLRGLASNPLLCASMCALWHFHGGRLPSSYGEIFNALVHMLVDRRDRERGVTFSPTTGYSQLKTPQKIYVLRQVAYYMMTNDNISRIPSNMILQWLSDQYYGGVPAAHSEIMSGFVERCAVIREYRDGEIEFVHATFKEYLASQHAIDLGDLKLATEHIADPEWSSFLVFACSHAMTTYSDRVLLEIEARLGSVPPDEDDSRRILAGLFVRCAAAAARLPPELRETEQNVRKLLVPPRNTDDALNLSQLGDEVCALLAFTAREEAEACACIQTLGLIGTQHARNQLHTYIEDSRITVRTELARYINPLHLREFANMVTSGSALPMELATNVASIVPIMEYSREITRLNLTECYITTCDKFDELTELEELILSRCPISDISALIGCKKLRFLDLSQTQVRDVTVIGNLPLLEKLDVSYSRCERFPDFRELGNLTMIDARRVPVFVETLPLGPNQTMRID